jgi:hypothetical protein
LALVLLVVGIGVGEPALAEPGLATERGNLERQLVELKQRARELDEQIRRIEVELSRQASMRAGVSDAALAAQPAGGGDCSLPFYLDSSGIKHVRRECLETASEPSCDLPFTLNENGIRSVRPACAPGAAPSLH